MCTEAVFLDEIQRKVFRDFLLAIQSHFYSFALKFLFLQTHATSYSFFSVSQAKMADIGQKKASLVGQHVVVPILYPGTEAEFFDEIQTKVF